MSSRNASGHKPQVWKAAGDITLGMGMEWAALSAWQEITLDHLLTHSSGLADYLVPCHSDAHKAGTIIAQAKNKPLAFKPGKGFSYSIATVTRRISARDRCS